MARGGAAADVSTSTDLADERKASISQVTRPAKMDFGSDELSGPAEDGAGASDAGVPLSDQALGGDSMLGSLAQTDAAPDSLPSRALFEAARAGLTLWKQSFRVDTRQGCPLGDGSCTRRLRGFISEQ